MSGRRDLSRSVHQMNGTSAVSSGGLNEHSRLLHRKSRKIHVPLKERDGKPATALFYFLSGRGDFAPKAHQPSAENPRPLYFIFCRGGEI